MPALVPVIAAIGGGVGLGAMAGKITHDSTNAAVKQKKAAKAAEDQLLADQKKAEDDLKKQEDTELNNAAATAGAARDMAAKDSRRGSLARRLGGDTLITSPLGVVGRPQAQRKTLIGM